MEKCLTNTLCVTHPEFKIYHYSWAINRFLDICALTSVLKLVPTSTFPFEIYMKSNAATAKVIFYVKGLSEIKQFTCQIILQSVQNDSLYSIPSCYDGEKLYHELSIAFLQKEGLIYVSDGTLRLYFMIYYMEQILHNIMHTKIKIENDVIDIGQLPSYDSYALIILKVEGKELFVNKDLLCAKSEYFKFLYSSDQKEDNRIQVIYNVQFEIVKMFISYIQTGNTYSIKKDLGTISSLFEMAKMYQVKDLETICEQFIKFYVTVDNCWQLLHFAHKHSATELLQFTIDYIVLNIKEISSKPEFVIESLRRPALISLLKKSNVITQEAIFDFQVPIKSKNEKLQFITRV